MSWTVIAYILSWPVRRLLRAAKGYLADISSDQPLHTWSSGDPRDETQQDGEHGKVGRRSFRRGLPKATFWSETPAWGPTVSCPNRYPSFSANAFLSKYLA